MTVSSTSPATGDAAGASHVSPVQVFARACAAEWTRLWTVKATWWFLLAAAVTMLGLGAVAGFDAAGDTAAGEGGAAWPAASIAAMPAQFALLALVLIAVTSDYATAGIVPTLQWTPRRGILFLARAIVAAGTATSLGVLLALGSAASAFAAAQSVLTLPTGEGVDALAAVSFVFAAGTVLAVGLGFLLRNTAGALVTVFLVMLVLPVLLPQFGYEWMSAIAQILPGSGAAFLLLGGIPGMTQASSVTVLLAWAGGALLLGWLRLVRDDANR